MADIKIDISVNQRRAAQQLENLRRTVDRTDKSVDNLTKSFNVGNLALGSFIGNLAAGAVSRAARGLFNLGAAAAGTISEIETLSTQFEVLTGSASEANRIVQDLQQFAARTPFQFTDLAKATQRLLSFGFSTKEAKDNLVDLGDVAAASGANLSELSLIFGQVSAAGKLTGERLLQLEERAIPIGPALAKTLGVAEESVRDLVSKGKVDFATFEEAFKSLNEEGQFAFGGLEKASKTLSGRFSTLQDNIQLITAQFGQALSPSLKAITTATTEFIQLLGNTQAFQRFGQSVGGFVPAAINVAIDGFRLLSEVTFGALRAFEFLRAGINTIVRGIIASLTGFIDTLANVANALGLQDTAIGKSLNSAKEFRDGVLEAMDETTEGFLNNAEELIQSQAEIDSAIVQSKDVFNSELAKIQEASNAETKTVVDNNRKKTVSTQMRTAAEIAELEKLRTAEDEFLKQKEERELARQEAKALADAELRQAQESNRLFELEQEILFQDQRLVNQEQYFTRREEAEIQAKLNSITNETERQTEITKIQAEGERRRLRFQEVSSRQQLQGAQNLFGALAGAAQQGGQRLFKITKAFQLAETITSGILAVQKAASALPYPANIPGIAAESIRAATNVARISSQNPSFEQGGIVPGSSFTGDNVQANVNSGEMILNRQQQANLFRIAQNGSGTSSGVVVNQPIVIELDNEAVGRATSQWVANGGQLGEVQ